MMIDRLEPRLQFATVSGVLFNDINNSKTFDSTETAQRGVTVFIDANANGTLDSGERTTTTDKRGRYTFANVAAGDHYIGTSLSASEYKSTIATDKGTVQGRFNIEFRNITDKANPTIKRALETAAQKWEQILTGDLPDVKQRDGSVVDDLVLDVTIAQLGTSTLAQAGPTALRADFSPYRGIVIINSLYAGYSQLTEVLEHEIGHALGLGTAWVAKQLITGRNSKDPRFTGDNAVREYNKLFETNNLSVPVENTLGSGSREGHWRETVLNKELLTSVAEFEGTEQPISRITVGQFEDMGYEVNYNAADDWNPKTGEVTLRTAADIGGVAGERKLTVAADDNISDLNFGFLANTAPTIRSFTISPSPVAEGTNITLTAAAIVDADGDSLEGVSFWRESNGIEGLQKDSDTFIAAKTTAKQKQYRVETATSGLVGDQQYYAVAVDSAGRAGRRTGVVSVQSVTLPTERPTGLAVRQRSSEVIRFSFTDDLNTGVTGYRIQVATTPSFGSASLVYSFNIGGDERATTIGGLQAGITYYIRVRAYNLAGSSSYSPVASFETA